MLQKAPLCPKILMSVFATSRRTITLQIEASPPPFIGHDRAFGKTEGGFLGMVVPERVPPRYLRQRSNCVSGNVRWRTENRRN